MNYETFIDVMRFFLAVLVGAITIIVVASTYYGIRENVRRRKQ